jgi:hypothetical protein
MSDAPQRPTTSHLHPGDEVELLRRVAIRRESVITCEPGDIATVEVVGDRGCLVTLHGMGIAVPHTHLRLHHSANR